MNFLKSSLEYIFKRIDNRALEQTANFVYPKLQCFLYDVVRINSSELQLSALHLNSIEYKGFRTVKEDTLVYRYEILIPDRPKFDIGTYKQILQGYCNQNALSYGAYGLNVYYKNIFAVFIEKIFFQGATLTIDVVYIDNAKSFNYCKHTVAQDTKKLKNKKAVNKLLLLLSK